MPNLNTLSAAALRQAASIQDQIADLTSRLNKILGGDSDSQPPREKKTDGRRRTMSPAARARIAAAQKARWAKAKGAASSSAPAGKAPAKSGKRQISPEARAKMAAAAKRRWAKVKAKQ